MTTAIQEKIKKVNYKNTSKKAGEKIYGHPTAIVKLI